MRPQIFVFWGRFFFVFSAPNFSLLSKKIHSGRIKHFHIFLDVIHLRHLRCWVSEQICDLPYGQRLNRSVGLLYSIDEVCRENRISTINYTFHKTKPSRKLINFNFREGHYLLTLFNRYISTLEFYVFNCLIGFAL